MDSNDQQASDQHEGGNATTRLLPHVGCRLAVSAALLSAWLAGCASQPRTRPTIAADQVRQAEAELTGRIREFADYFEATVVQATIEIERRARPREERRAAAMWRVHSIQQCRSHAGQDDPREAMVDLWTLCQRQLDYFSEGNGKSLFGEYQPIALAAAQEIYAAVEQLVRDHVREDAFDNSKARVLEYARQHPIEGVFGGQPPERLSDDTEVQNALASIVTLPLAPLAALRGVGEASGSVRDVSRSVDRFTDVVEDFPATARWQLELLAMNLEELSTVSEASESFKKLADSSTQLAENSTQFIQLIDAMPAQVREEAQVLLERVDTSQPELRSTLGEAQKTVELIRATNHDLKGTASQVEQTAAGVGEAAAALEHAANAVTITIQEIQKLVPAQKENGTNQAISPAQAVHPDAGYSSDPRIPNGATLAQGDEPTRRVTATSAREAGSTSSRSDPSPAAADTSFSFQAITESANALGETSVKLQGLLTDLRAFVDAKPLSQESGAVTATFEGMVDHVAKRSAQVLLLLFFLALGYAVIRMLLQRAAQRPAGA